MLRRLIQCVAVFVLGVFTSSHAAAVTIVFQDDLVGFEAAAGGPVPIVLDFDSLTTGTDLAGSPLGGITLNSPAGNTLEVVDGLSTFTTAGFTGVIDANTNRLFPTSGGNVLSPGGVALVPGSVLEERDSLEILFGTPQSAVGFDILYQSLDIGPNTLVQTFNATGTLIVSYTPIGSGAGGSPGGSIFIGIVSDDVSTHISRILVTETDGDAIFPDSNIGYDTLRALVPEPTAGLLLCMGLPALALRARGFAGNRNA